MGGTEKRLNVCNPSLNAAKTVEQIPHPIRPYKTRRTLESSSLTLNAFQSAKGDGARVSLASYQVTLACSNSGLPGCDDVSDGLSQSRVISRVVLHVSDFRPVLSGDM